ncbi:MAG: gtaB [Rickettsiales bacterium]|jgi:UTP--glucose-1-phosphate uridylyltransferase|nr:gtaB [Rickettsiales bacterium]
MNKPIKTAVFPVGGLGTRFLPATKSMPKEMLPVASKPLIQYAFEEAVEAGIEQFIFITGRNKNAISNHFDHSYELESILLDKGKGDLLAMSRDWMPAAGQTAFVRQQKPLGLGHAVWCARHLISNEPFAVLLADDMFLSPGGSLTKQMVDAYAKAGGGNIIAISDVPREHTERYGIIEGKTLENGLINISSMVEKPKPSAAPSTLAISGRYILQPEIFDYLEEHKTGSGGEIQLTDAMAAMLKSSPFYGYVFEGKRFDCGNQLGFLDANIAFALKEASDRESVLDILRHYTNENADSKQRANG